MAKEGMKVRMKLSYCNFGTIYLGLSLASITWSRSLNVPAARANALCLTSFVKCLHELPVEILQNILDYVVIDIPDLPIRHVCRGFRDCTLKAMAAIISAHTAFNLRSMDSMMNLRSMAEHTELAKRITSLTIASCFVPDNVPRFSDRLQVLQKPGTPTKRNMLGAEYLSSSALQHLKSQRKKNHAWDLMTSNDYFENLRWDTDGPLIVDPIITILHSGGLSSETAESTTCRVYCAAIQRSASRLRSISHVNTVQTHLRRTSDPSKRHFLNCTQTR
jgi:hypothetical protein